MSYIEAPVDAEIAASMLIKACFDDDFDAFTAVYEQMIADPRLTLAVVSGLVATLVCVCDAHEPDWRAETTERLAELMRRDVKSADDV
jgi:hypothetical protein